MRLRGVLLAAAVGVLTAGCLVDIEKVADPGPAFARARARAERLSGRPGPAGQLNLLVYDRGERQLVRVSLPMWLVRKMGAHDGVDFDVDEGHAGEVARRAARRLRLEDLDKAGLGILTEVEEEGGDQVLVWLS
jgi:predicted outer membrane lipoprotein